MHVVYGIRTFPSDISSRKFPQHFPLGHFSLLIYYTVRGLG